MKLLILLGLIGLSLAVERFETPCYKQSNHLEVFSAWKKHFGKEYATVDIEASKFNQFLDNWKMINEHNSGESSYEMGLNQFADMSGDEFRLYIHGHSESCLSKRRSWEKVEEYQPSLAKLDVPSSVDWTTKGVVTPVKNQGQCGSCWAFSTTGSIESRTAIKTGKLTSLSEQQLVDCSGSYGNMGCNGGLMDYAFQYVKNEGGLCTEEAYPYTARDGTCKASSCGTKYDPVNGYVDVKSKSEADLQAAVAEGPVSIAIEADQSAFQFYKSGILDGNCGTRLDHGVLAVGYGSQGGQDYWKVKNSWGASWGEEGYVLICRNCNKNAGAGECGLLDEPSYPTV